MEPCILSTVEGKEGYCADCKRFHRGHAKTLALDEGPMGVAQRKIWRAIASGEHIPPDSTELMRKHYESVTGRKTVTTKCNSCDQPPDTMMARKSRSVLEAKTVQPQKQEYRIGFLSKVKHYVGSQLVHVASGAKKVPAEVRSERRSSCEICPHRDTIKDECRLCGCPLHATILGDKLAMATEFCPAGRWGTWPEGKGKVDVPYPLGKIAVYILAIPKRLQELKATMQRWEKTDWPGNPIVVMQHPDEKVATQRDRWKATARNSYNLIHQMHKDDLDWGLFTEDDIEPNLHLYWNLCNWAPMVRKEMDIASLYMPNTVELPFFPTAEERPEEKYRIAVVNKEEAWRIPKPMRGKFPRHNLWGSQCYVMSRRFITYCVEQWWNVSGGQDSRVNRLANMMGVPIYYHLPDLVQHHHPATGSNFNSPNHHSADFDPDWKSPPFIPGELP